MSTATDSVRRIARHALPSRRDLNDELRRLRHEKKADTAYVQKLQDDNKRLAAELATALQAKTRAQENARRFDAEHAVAKADAQQRAEEAERLAIKNRFLRQKLHGRDTSHPEDQVTEPTDVRQLREAVREGRVSPVIRVVPAHRSPLAAVVDPGQVTDETTVEIPVFKLPKAVA